MALIDCPDCGNEMSDAAIACPRCARPVRPATIQLTAKRHKQTQLCGGIMAAVGFAIARYGMNSPTDVVAYPIGALLLLGGVLIFVAGAATAWWEHG